MQYLFFTMVDAKMVNSGPRAVRIKVDCYAGYTGEETPRRLWIGFKKVKVDEVIDRWVSPDHRFFKLKGDDGVIYVIRFDPIEWEWELEQQKQER